MTDEQFIHAVKKVSIGPDDFLVLQTDRHLSRNEAEQLKTHVLKSAPGLVDRILVLDSGITLTVITPQQIAGLDGGGATERATP